MKALFCTRYTHATRCSDQLHVVRTLYIMLVEDLFTPPEAAGPAWAAASVVACCDTLPGQT